MMETRNRLLFVYISMFLLRYGTGQSVKGGSRSVKGGSYSQQSSRTYSQSQIDEPVVQRQSYSQNQAISARHCDRPSPPMNGRFSCQVRSDRYICTATCSPGYEFPDKSESMNLECDQRTGYWTPYATFPACVSTYGGGQRSSRQGSSHSYSSSHGSSVKVEHSSSQTSSQRSHSQVQTYQGRGQNLCGQPTTPRNGANYCSMSNGQWSCQATCNPGYAFPDGRTQVTITCHERDGRWSPTDRFEDCRALCHPPCENGGRCSVNNQCSCPSTHRGNRCQYPVSLCEFSRLSSDSLHSDCRHNPEYTECNVACPPGMAFDPPTSSLYRCTVDGHWNPPTPPQCRRDNLCEKPPSPMNGRIDCQGNQEIFMCIGSCKPGYMFSDGFSELTIQCVRRTGEWTPDASFPDCEASCRPHCENGGKCIGHNKCLCTRDYRGDRCEYPTSNCDGHDRFASVAWHCRDAEKETVCNISCRSPQKLQPPQPTVYTCSLDGSWEPDLKPICVADMSQTTRMSSRYESHHGENTFQSGFSSQNVRSRPDHGGYFGGQEQMDYDDFGGQQQIEGDDFNFDYDGQRPVRVPQRNIGQSRVDYDFDDNEQQQKIQEIERLQQRPRTRQEQGLEEMDVDLNKVENGDIDEKFRLGNEDAQEIINQHELETNDKSDMEMFSKMEGVTNYKGICSSWGFFHYRSFDGGLFTYPSSCWYVMATSYGDDLIIGLKTDCNEGSRCTRVVLIKHLQNRYFLSYEHGVIRNGVPLDIPTQAGDLTVERITRYIVARLTLGYTIWLNEENSIFIAAEPYMMNGTVGLCGNYDGILDYKFFRSDGSKTFDIFSFFNSWKMEDIDESCMDDVEPKSPCNDDTRDRRIATDKSSLACAAIYNLRFDACAELLDPNKYYIMCTLDCCSEMAKDDCECATIAEYLLECARGGVDMSEGWRTPGLCPMVCTNGTEYSECGPPCPPTCEDQEPTCQQERCVDGCHCPEGKVLENGQCITIDQCPCHYGDIVYSPGDTMDQDCNTCVCQDGNWQCTDSVCPATCSISGPHFTTFDGLMYDYNGECPHYLVESDDFHIQLDYGMNCREDIYINGICIRGITIHTSGAAVVKIKSTMEVTVNGREMTSLPVLAPGVYVGRATSSYMKAYLKNGLEILWDLDSTIHIYSPTELFGKLRGLCGTFTKNQQDEFLTPEGDVEKTANIFAKKWMVEELCQDIPQLPDVTEEEKPCEKYPKRREMAAKVCDFMKGSEFSDCHPLIDYTRYYSNCMEDICDCEIEPEFCACLSLSNYAAACAKKGKPLSWRQAFPPCGISCPMGQMYLSCANPCSYSCSEIANSYSSCRDSCVEGCMCPPGQTLDAHGTCVPVSTCSCVHSGHAYPPDYLQRRGKEMCACSQGHWDCHEATTADILLTPPPHVAPDCNVSAGMEPTECVTECPLTCSNYHHHQPCAVSVCVPGCRCKKGYVLDTTSNICVKPQNCPCHHSGRSYEEGAQVTMDCNTCICEGGSWNCDSNPCPGLCSAWGDSHFETFDGRLFDFDGVCDYVMVKAHVSDSVIFSVVVQNVPCGIGGGAKCGKAVSITLGSSNVILTREHPLPVVPETSGFTVSSAGMFTLVSTDIGITVQWDRNTRVYVIAQPMWEGKLQGLCGDFNSDASDDFRPPSGGIPLVLAKDFADSWRVHKYCKPAKQPKDACEQNPERRSWSRQKCIVLKSDLFKPCHHQVEVEEYYKRCVFDTCACNAGGDCECLCAVIAAYAQKCARRGIVIPWRSQELCPMQCEACDRYSPCISLCPPPSCDTYLDSPEAHTCSREPCVEGCEPKPCEAGYVHKSAFNITCVPEEFCKEKPCAVIDGVPYREGERIEREDVGDACQSCYCRHGAVECVGVPCTEAIITTIRPYIVEVTEQCKFTGWTDWFNSVDPSTNAGRDFEKLGELADDLRLPCPITHVKSVQCRDANTLVPVDATNEQVICDLETGMECDTGNCLDYEMRAYCQCQEEVTCPPGQEWNSCAFDCENSCQALQEDLKQQGLCNNGEKCAPGCTANVCKLPYLARDPKTCVFPETCTCKLSTGFVLAPGQVMTSGCEKCQCLNNTLICSATHDCKAPEVRMPPPGVTGTVVGLPYTPPTLVCKDGWTNWLNTHLPDRDGDTELLVDLIDKGLAPCSLEDIKEINCRNAKDPQIEMQDGVFCDLKAGGLVCRNRDMIKPSRCSDYEIRVFCSCAEPKPEVTKTTTETTLPVTGTTEIFEVTSPSFKLVTFKGAKPQRVKRPHLVGNFGFIMTTPACSAWSAWINKSRPRKGKKHGEKEDTRHYILKQTEGFCTEGSIIAIECREVKSDMDYTETKEEKLVCDLNKGFICLNRNQPDGRCQDYKIRYLCSCEEVTTQPSIFIKTTTPAYIYPCVDFVPLIDGEKPLPDSNIKASSSASSISGPDAARMKAGIGKAWTASVEDQKQFIEVNLDDVRAIYGVITKGKPLSNEWVTSYQLLYSNDGVSYSYYQDESDNNKVFSANFDDQNEVKHIFSRPFEAKYVRLEPLTWEKKISLRLELLGCSEAVRGITEPTIPFTEPVKVLEGCTTSMGMEDRSLPDSRLTASSEYDSEHSVKYGRLGSDTAWMAADLDFDQYFQINFPKKANISGVKTKGRQDSPEWVKSYIIAYSNDGLTWEKITDENGIPKEFLANTDQYTTVTNMLPNVLIAKYLRIIPTKWEKWISMQVEILGCTPAEMEKLIALKPVRLPRPQVRPGIGVPVFGLTVKECRKPMGLENGLLLDSQLSATSSYSSRFTPDFARMGSDSVWAAENLKDRQYFQVDFLDEQNVTGIITKGREDIPQWVTAYTVSYSNDGIVWNPIKGEDGTKKEFSANYDPFALVTNYFPTMIRTRFLRIEPTKWKNWISMQVEILGCYHPLPCHDPMGIDNGVITDHQLYASSSISDDMSPAKSRLSSATAWSPAKYDKNPFIAVDFLEPTNLTGVITKGNPNAQEWVISYQVSYSNDSIRWLKVQNPDGKTKDFLGNDDQDSAVINLFPIPVIARYLSIHPIKFHRWTSLRIEILGCYHEQVCREPMGLENGVLADAQISASSSANPDTTPDHVRINDESGWQPRTFDAKPYLQVDFLEPRNVSAVVTKGMKDTDHWVTKFKVIYSQDGDSWQPLVDESADVLEFPANKDRDTPVVNAFPEAIESRYFRITPLDYHNAIGLRLELLGCYHPYVCQEPLGMESGSVYDFQLSASSYSSPTLSPPNARMDSDTAWVADKDDDNPFIQVDLLTFTNITGIMTQGRNDANEWVTAYKLEYSGDGQEWINVEDDSGNAMEFKGNFDNESPVTNLFPDPIFTRFLRIKPTQSKSSVSLRFEILGCFYENVCLEPMGIENELLPDSRITASSSLSETTSPSSVRLNSDSSWSPATVDEPQFLQVDFENPRNISAVVTKGDAKLPQWVTSFQVAYSSDEDNWIPVTNAKGEAIEFPANTDNESPVTSLLPETFEAQYIRIIPTDWKNWISLRAEILGCYHPYEPFVEVTAPPEEVLSLTALPTEPIMAVACPNPMEAENTLLVGARIQASSFAPNSSPSRIPLNTVGENGLSGGWVPEVKDLHPVLIIELPEPKLLTSINIQGREDEENWVKSLRVIASINNSTWLPVFGPDGNEVIEGNEDQNSVVGHYFEKPMEVKYIKIIPETWHRWPSFRLDLRGCHIYPEVTAVPELRPSLCPELLNEPDLTTNCPADCPDGLLCNGEECVDPVDCSCVIDGKIYQVSDRVEDHACRQCDCALGGRSVCADKKCPPCKEDERSSLGANCECKCEKCADYEVLCPTSHECIPKKRWCDDIVDCPDDETNCPITTEIPVTPIVAILPTPPPVPENATCDIMGKHINTFDGQDITYDICHHVVMKDILNAIFNSSIHKSCDYVGDCKHWIEVSYRNHKIKVHSNLTVEFDGHTYSAMQLVKLSKKTKSRRSLIIEKVGDQVLIKSIARGFTIMYDNMAHLKVEVSPGLLKRLGGLCGFYSGVPEDDQKKPDGKTAYTSREFGDSWTVGNLEKDCAPVICPHEVMSSALEECNKLKEEPFTECGKFLSVGNFIEFCMSSICECMHQGKNSLGKCKCDSFQPFAEECEAKLGPKAIRTWRLKHECVPKCPPGMEWNDCGPSCQITCDSASNTSLEECSGKCVSGCFCPPGTVLNEDICVPPDQCADQVCQGFGDPHFQTFDGLIFPLQAEGSFLIVGDKEKDIAINGFSRKCGLFSSTTCLTGMEILYKDSKVLIKKHKELMVDDVKVPMEKLPLYSEGMVILGYPGRTFVVVIPQINLEARYYEENSGFAVKIPSRTYFNKTEGLCGNCNGQKDDELKEKPLSEFVCDFQTEGDKEECKKSLIELPDHKEMVPICNKLNDPIFEACHPLVDLDVFIDACSFDSTHSGDSKASLCKTAMEYGRQCCQAGTVIEGWPEKLGCDIQCPEGLQFEQCHRGCPQTCVSVKNVSSESPCSHLKADGCFCPEGEVLKDGVCVAVALCDTCDEEGHVPGDSWNDGDCKKCHCRADLTTECDIEVCPAKPICSLGESLAKVNDKELESSCCETYVCVPKEKGCPPVDVPKCPKGEVAKIDTGSKHCPEFKCECDPALCSPVVWPEGLEEGQTAEMVNDSCCPRVEVTCHPLSCPEKPECEEHLELIETEGECCTTYKCKPPKDVCVYTYNYEIIDGLQSPVDPANAVTKVYKLGDEWKDGLCEKCSCVESKGQLGPLCTVEQCPLLENIPEKEEYVLHEYQVPEKCCPDIFKVQCKDEFGNVYEPEEQWSDENDPCITYICEKSDTGDVRKMKSVINCTECPRTATYFPPSKILGQCCGLCKTTKCEDGEDLYEVGDSWVSRDQPCRKAECINEFGKIKTIYTMQPCPVIPKDCPEDKIVWDQNGCCKICNLTSEISCSTGPIPEEDTIGFFTFQDMLHGGVCVNEKPVSHVLRCSGACHSHSYYSLEDGDFKDMCLCCKVNVTINRTIELRCPDGNYITKTFLQPESCQCSKCAPKIKEKNTGKTDYNSNPWSQSEETVNSFKTFQIGQEPEDTDNWEISQAESFSPFEKNTLFEDNNEFSQQEEI